MPRPKKQLAGGHRSGTDYDSVREIIDASIKPKDWRAMCAALKKQALAGNVRAYVALRDTRFGPPYFPAQSAVDIEPLRIEALVAVKPDDA